MTLGFNEKMELVLKPGVVVGCGEREGCWEVFIRPSLLHQKGSGQGCHILTHLSGVLISKW